MRNSCENLRSGKKLIESRHAGFWKKRSAQFWESGGSPGGSTRALFRYLVNRFTFLLLQTSSVSLAQSLISGVSWPASHLDIPVFMTLAMPPSSVNCRDLVTGFSLLSAQAVTSLLLLWPPLGSHHVDSTINSYCLTSCALLRLRGGTGYNALLCEAPPVGPAV